MALLRICLALALFGCLAEAYQLPVSKQKQLPEVSEISHGAQTIMTDLSTQVNSLQGILTDVHEKGQDALRQRKAVYEQQLARQEKENAALVAQNSNISEQIESIRHSNAALRSEADNIAKTCKLQQEELSKLQQQEDLAQEFTKRTMDSTTELLGAAELDILSELRAADELKQKDEYHQSRLMDIEHDRRVAFLELQSSSAGSPQDMLRTLMSSIDELSRQQNASATVMEATFSAALKKLVDAHALLLDEQVKLNATRASATNFSERLRLAVRHLTKVHNGLTQKLSALRTFHVRLGGGSQPVSLLQIGQNSLPDVSTLVKEQQQVLKGLNSKISALEAGLTEKEQEGKRAVEQLKADFEGRLMEQSKENKKMEDLNRDLALRVEDLDTENLGLRKQAQALKAEAGKLEADLKKLKSNISAAQEFATLALESSNAMLDNSSKLEVLNELEEQESLVFAKHMHEESLRKVANGTAFLQVSVSSSKGIEKPKDLLASLEASLHALKQEQNVSEASLKASFEQEFKVGAEKYRSLAEEQAKLNATIAEKEVLQDKLRAAVHHLKITRDDLLEKSRSLRGFAKKVSEN